MTTRTTRTKSKGGGGGRSVSILTEGCEFCGRVNTSIPIQYLISFGSRLISPEKKEKEISDYADTNFEVDTKTTARFKTPLLSEYNS